MPMDLDEHDLYPPDHEDLTPEARRHRNRVAVGTGLVVWGTAILVERALSVELDTFFLAVGLAALAGWSQFRRYRWFVVGAIATAIGVGDLARGPFDGAFGSSLSMLALAGGFAAVYVRYPQRSSWTLPVAAFFTVIAVASLGLGLIGLIPSSLGRFVLPVLLIGGGTLLLLRNSLPPRTVKMGLAGVALSFVLIAATSVPDTDAGDRFGAGEPAREQRLPDLDGRTLVLRDGDGDVELRRSRGSEAFVEVRGRERRRGDGPVLEIREKSDEVVIDVERRGLFRGRGAVDYVLTLPDGVEVDIERDDGDVDGELAGARGTIRTAEGDIDLVLRDGGVEGSAGDGPYRFESDRGDVTIDSRLRLALDVAVDDGRIEIDGDVVRGDDFRSPESATGAAVEVEVATGDVVIDLPTGSA